MPLPRVTPERSIENFCKRFEILDNGCWEWTAGKSGSGYGYHYDGTRSVRAHRFAYKLAVDPDLPDDLTLDHLCRNRACVNPDHLEAVPIRVNILRSTGPSAVNAVKTHCVNGHEFTPENTRIGREGHRGCWTCLNSNWKKHREARNERDRRPTPCPDCGQVMNRSSVRKHQQRKHDLLIEGGGEGASA